MDFLSQYDSAIIVTNLSHFLGLYNLSVIIIRSIFADSGVCLLPHLSFLQRSALDLHFPSSDDVGLYTLRVHLSTLQLLLPYYYY